MGPKKSTKKASSPSKKSKSKQVGYDSKGNRAAAVSGSKKAGVLMPVGRLNRMIKKGRYATRSGRSAGAFMAGVLEYCCAEFLELAGNLCQEAKKKLISPRHLQLAIRNDDELAKVMHSLNANVASGGYDIGIEAALLPKKKGNKAAKE